MSAPNLNPSAGNAGSYARQWIKGSDVASNTIDLDDPAWMVVSNVTGQVKVTTLNDETIRLPVAQGVPVYVGIKRLWATGHVLVTPSAVRLGR